ncbi:uncharacterized protein [Dermacentor albipictus]|uniref:uncharacterized protein n=1 Tax=Dermacentor albipictus TaxID=60249 RepID=UPI0038FCA123
MPHVKTLCELVVILRSHFNPALSTLMMGFRFNSRSRREVETLGQFVAALRGLASACVFGNRLDSMLRDRFLCGINNLAIQTRLLELPDLSLDDSVKAALAIEVAAKDASQISRATGSPSAEAAVNKLATKSSTCGRCGAYVQGSLPKGVWRGRAAAGSSSSAARLHVVAENTPILYTWLTGFVPSCVLPYMLTIEICGHPISMELDAGASVSVMVAKLFKRTFPGVSVEASGVMLRSYSGQRSHVQGQAQVSVCFCDREATLPLYLKKGSSPTLLGRNCIHALGVCLPEYQEASVHVVKDAPSLLTEFKSLFPPGVGTFAGTTADIYVAERARPRFFQPRPLPFALKDWVTQEL